MLSLRSNCLIKLPTGCLHNVQLLTHSVFVERFTEIERENRILLEKMTNILQNPKGISHANAHLTNA